MFERHHIIYTPILSQNMAIYFKILSIQGLRICYTQGINVITNPIIETSHIVLIKLKSYHILDTYPLFLAYSYIFTFNKPKLSYVKSFLPVIFLS